MLYNLTEWLQNWLDSVGLYPLVQVMYQLEFRAFLAVLLSFGIVLAGMPRLIRRLQAVKFGDSPEFYNGGLNELMASKKGTPTMGGLLLCGSVLLTTLLLTDIVHSRLVHIAVAVLVWLAALGAWDDWLKLTQARRQAAGQGPSREGLFAWEKLVFQFGIGIIACWFLYGAATTSDAHVMNLPFQRTYLPSPTEGALQAPELAPGVWIMGLGAFVLIGAFMIAFTSNAVNLTDGLDGLAGGTLLIASFAMMVLTWIAASQRASYHLMVPHVPGAGELMVVAGAMAGACLGFLWFNVSPAQVFMGDTGSLAMGGLLAYIGVAIRQEALLVLIGGVFYLEALSVMAQVGWFKYTARRFGEGRRILRCAPVHHHFQMCGWKETQVVGRFYLVAVTLAILAIVSLKLR
ncbi:MAG: phospho-N-acetylmuramoyl-pentapeptide-transferase [Phycisphaerales bacterium]